MVYAFHASSSSAESKLLKRAIRIWQYVQLLGGTTLALLSYTHNCTSMYSTKDILSEVLDGKATRIPLSLPSHMQALIADVVPALLYATYFILFQLEIRDVNEVKQD